MKSAALLLILFLSFAPVLLAADPAQVQSQMDGFEEKIQILQNKVDQDMKQLGKLNQQARTLAPQLEAACAKGESDPDCVQLTRQSQQFSDLATGLQNQTNADQAQLRLQTMFYQEFIQQAPRMVPALNEDTQAVASNLDGN